MADLNKLLGFIADRMPPTFEVVVVISKLEASMSLERNGEDVDVCLDDLTAEEMLIECLHAARLICDMEKVQWPATQPEPAEDVR